MKPIKEILFVFIGLLLTSTLSAQAIKDSLSFTHSKYRKDIFSTSFEKRLNTYNLNNKLNYSLNFNKMFIGINSNYFSSVVTASDNNIKDELALSIIGEYRYSPIFRFGVLTQSGIYSDDRKIAINEASNIYSTLFAKYIPIDQLIITPYGGYSINRQLKENDQGAIYGGNIILDRYSLNEFQISSTLKLQNEDISPRTNSHQLATIRVKNNIDNTLTNLISAKYSNTKKDFYFEADSVTSNLYSISKNIQSRTEKKYFIEERIYSSRFASDLFFDLTGRVSARNIDRKTKFKNIQNIGISTYDSKIEEFRLDFSGTTEYRSDVFFGKVKIDYSERDENHSAKDLNGINPILFDQRIEQEKKKNNTSQYTTVSAFGNYFISAIDNITFSLLHRKLVYNTASEENFDDRDELLSIGRISYLRNVNHLFNFFVNLEGSFNHIVYLFAERSSNNNIRRIIKLSSGGEYSGSNIYSTNIFEVSANYTSYDFEDINPNSRSFSFRQFNAKDSTSIKLIGNLYGDFSGYVKLSEQGNFNWKNFSNNPDRFLAEYYLEPMFKIRKTNFRIGVGVRFFSLQTFSYTAENFKRLTDEYTSIGPITNFQMITQNVNINFYGWYEFINNQKNVKRGLANLSLSVNWKL